MGGRWFDKGIGAYRSRAEQNAFWANEFEKHPNLPDGVRAERIGCKHETVWRQRTKRGIPCVPYRQWAQSGAMGVR